MKKDATVAVHVPDEVKDKFLTMASAEGTDMSGLGRKLFIEYLEKKELEYQHMRSAFEKKENHEN